MASKGVNKVIIVGNLGSDPEMKQLPTGIAVANISVATSETWIDKDSNQQSKTEWHRVVFFNKLAEIAGKYLHKGSKVYCEGKLQTRKWTDKDGIERYMTEIVANEMQMLDPKGSSPVMESIERSQNQRREPQVTHVDNDPIDDIEDIPF